MRVGYFSEKLSPPFRAWPGAPGVSPFSPLARHYSRDRLVILAVFLALLPVAFIAVMAGLDLRPWWRQLRDIRSLPEVYREEVKLRQ